MYHGSKEPEEEFSDFIVNSECIKIDVKVKISDIRFDKLDDTGIDNALAGYSYFYKMYDDGIADGLSVDDAFERARRECIKEGYLQNYINKEDFIVEYKKLIFDYDTQLRLEGRAEGESRGEARGKEEAIAVAIQSGVPLSLVETIAEKSGISKDRLAELVRINQNEMQTA